MTSQQATRRDHRDPVLLGQTVVLLGGTAAMSVDTARLVRAAGAELILAGRDADGLRHASKELDPLATAVVDAGDPAHVGRFLSGLPGPIDHVVVHDGGRYQAPLAEFDFIRAQRDVDEQLWLPMHVARAAVGTVRPVGTLLFVGGPSGSRSGRSFVEALTAARPALIAHLALEVAPIRINLIGGGIVDRPLSARLLGETLHRDRRHGDRGSLPIARIVRPADVAALAVHIMCSGTLTGATYHLDGHCRSS